VASGLAVALTQLYGRKTGVELTRLGEVARVVAAAAARPIPVNSEGASLLTRAGDALSRIGKGQFLLIEDAGNTRIRNFSPRRVSTTVSQIALLRKR